MTEIAEEIIVKFGIITSSFFRSIAFNAISSAADPLEQLSNIFQLIF